MSVQRTRQDDAGVATLPGVHIDRPTIHQGAALWRIAAETRVLDVNSSYAYLLWARDFADTSAVAVVGDEVAGFVTGYTRPDRPDTLFVWQVAVAEEHRGRGLARRMLDDLLDRTRPRGVQFLETTVTTANGPSIALFTAVAREHGVRHKRSPMFPAYSFPDPHEAEELHRLGPWPAAPPTVAGGDL